MKKFEIKMFDVNSKVRTLIGKADSVNDMWDKTVTTINDFKNNSIWVQSDDKRLINLSNIVEIHSIEEVKEEEI
ncbi:hypothetical protein LABALGNA3A7_09620 [Dellaglioa algida]|nr:hypothetical protein LABALGNA3A7_09620 [Dellaglioa algida]